MNHPSDRHLEILLVTNIIHSVRHVGAHQLVPE